MCHREGPPWIFNTNSSSFTSIPPRFYDALSRPTTIHQYILSYMMIHIHDMLRFVTLCQGWHDSNNTYKNDQRSLRWARCFHLGHLRFLGIWRRIISIIIRFESVITKMYPYRTTKASANNTGYRLKVPQPPPHPMADISPTEVIAEPSSPFPSLQEEVLVTEMPVGQKNARVQRTTISYNEQDKKKSERVWRPILKAWL